MNNRENKIPLKLDLNTLDLFTLFSVSEDRSINRTYFSALKKLINMIDDNIYRTDANLMGRFVFVKRVLDARLKDRMTNLETVYNYASDAGSYSGIIQNHIIPYTRNNKLSFADINYVVGIINNNLQYGFIFNQIEPMSEMIEMAQNDGVNSVKMLVDKFESMVSLVMGDIRRHKASQTTEREFDLAPDKLFETLNNIVEEYRQPESVLQTGYTRLNEMLGGGFHKAKIYCFMGSTGGFKSGLLINLLKTLKINNEYKSKDPNKKPTILYVTQENSIKESVARLFNTMCPEHIKNYNATEIMSMMEEHGLDMECNGINIRMKFIQGGTVTTSVFYDLASDLDDEGYEVIALLHDYVKTMKPETKANDLRIEMANVVRELKYVGVNLDIPVITVAQLNREAAKTLDSTAGTAKADITRLLGRGNIGESWSMIEELDWGCIINREYHEQHNSDYLVFKNIKSRYLNPPFTYFAQPFEMTNGFALIEDMDKEKPLSVFTMKGNYDNIIGNNTTGKRNSVVKRIDLDEQMNCAEDAGISFDKYYNNLNKVA